MAASRSRHAAKRKLSDADWKRRNKAKTNAYTRKWWRTRGKEQSRVPQSEWYQGSCLGCGKTVKAVRAGGVRRLYCSPKCKRKYRILKIGLHAARAEWLRSHVSMRRRRPDYQRLRALRDYERQILDISDPFEREARAVLLAFRRATIACCMTTREEMAFVRPFLTEPNGTPPNARDAAMVEFIENANVNGSVSPYRDQP